MKSILVAFFCLIGIIAGEHSNEEQPLVNAPIGQIRGSILTSRLGRDIYSFRGVRYGEPPTGHQRFQVRILYSNAFFTFLRYLKIPVLFLRNISRKVVVGGNNETDTKDAYQRRTTATVRSYSRRTVTRFSVPVISALAPFMRS